jgi:tRNA-dihydrouridine synthase A
MISKKTTLYTEMVMSDALVYNANRLDDFIGYSQIEEPLVVQLGVNNATQLAEAASLCEGFGKFAAINL